MKTVIERGKICFIFRLQESNEPNQLGVAELLEVNNIVTQEQYDKKLFFEGMTYKEVLSIKDELKNEMKLLKQCSNYNKS